MFVEVIVVFFDFFFWDFVGYRILLWLVVDDGFDDVVVIVVGVY